MKATKTWVLIVLLIISAINVHAWPVPDTGQTKCYNNSGEIPCPQPGEAFYGQDGNYTIDPPSYSKLDVSGNALPDDTASWVMVKDNVTGLIWENKTSDGSIHDSGKIFTWCDTNPATNRGGQGTCGTGTGAGSTDTEAFIKALNAERFGGFSDWRMPTAKELTTIEDLSRRNPVFNPDWFSNASSYWASTSSSAANAWNVYVGTGRDSFAPKSLALGARAVRGGQIESRYVDNGDGTVTDTASGLMWQQGTVGGKTWQAALDYAESLTLAGYDDWRLPTLTELKSIIDFRRYNPAINTTLFPGTASSRYWSSTSYASNITDAWSAHFGEAGANYNDSKSDPSAARAVRGGQSRSFGSLVISAPVRTARWEIGGQKTISWDTAGIPGNVKMTLSRQGGKSGTFTEVIAESIPNSGTYNWTVTGPESFNCALRIEPANDPSKGTTQSLFAIKYLLRSFFISAETYGDPGRYKLVLAGQYADMINPLETTFNVSDTSVATVNAYGFLTALKNGYVEVSTIYSGITYKKGLFVYTGGGAQESFSNNTKATAMTMTEGSFYKGTLPQDDMDYFKFTLTADSNVSNGFLSTSTAADVKAEVFNASDNVVASGTSTNGLPLTFPLGLPVGDYYLKLTSAGDIDQTNNYIVTYKITGSLPAKTSIPIGIGESKQGVINSLTEATDFTFTLAQSQGIKLTFRPSGDIGQYRLALLDGSGTPLDQIDCLNSLPVSLEGSYFAGSYTLRITPMGTIDASSPFSVTLAAGDTQLEKEINDTTLQSNSWDITRPITGRLYSSTDTDFYTFVLTTPRYLDLLFSAPGGTRSFTLTLYKESEQYQIDSLTISGQSATLPMGLGVGRYYLKVSGTSPDTVHSYTLSFQNSSQTNMEIESNNTRKFANAIEKNKTMRGRIYSLADLDFYGFNLPAGGAFTIQFTPTSTTADYKVTVMDEGGNGETYQSANGQVLNTPIEAPAGNYYLKIEPNGDIDQTNSYELTLTGTAEIVGIKEMVGVTVSGENSALTPTQTRNLMAQVSYSDASTANVTMGTTWTSLNPNIATVDGAGQVTAVAQGTTSIVASYGGLTGKFDLIVGAPQNVVKQHYGNLILVAGGGVADTNTLKESTQYLSDLVYKRFKARLFMDEDIWYFNPWPAHDLDGDGYVDNIVDDVSPTVSRFGQAITNWAASLSTDGPLYVYLIDHGGIDNFMIYPGEIVTADQLKAYLDNFQTQTKRKVIVIIEACKSGSFTDNLITQGQDRVVVTSADDQDSYIQLGGRISFSQFLVDRLLTGDSLHSAYLKAKQQLSNMGLPYSKMQPKLIEGVNLSSTAIRLGGDFAIASLFPEIVETSSNMNVTANTTQNFYAKLSSLEGIEAVWAVVVSPDYIPPDPTQNLQAPTVTLPTITLTDSDKDRRYEGIYNNFIYNGDYRITFYARNSNGNVSVSPSIAITVTGGQNTTSTLMVTKTGTGSGTVTSAPAGITCGTDCTETYTQSTQVTLTATADSNSVFTGWSGTNINCPGTGACIVLIDSSRVVTATFSRKIVKGDLNNDGNVNLSDAILAIQAFVSLNTPSIRTDYVTSGTDVNGDSRISLAEVIYILQKAAALR